MTYDEYEHQVTELLKIKLTNYRLTSNDISFLIQLVYTEIATEVKLDFNESKIIMDENTMVYDTNVIPLPTDPVDLLGGLTLALDDNYIDVTKMFDEVSPGIYEVNHFACEGSDEAWLHYQHGREITFMRDTIPDINFLSDRIYILLLNVTVAGVIYHAHESIPSPTSSNVPFSETGMEYKFYRDAIARLKNQLPQVRIGA